MSGSDPAPLRVFWSYSHKDEALRDKLDTHLAALKRTRRVEVWHDRKIPAGANWRADIDRELDSADIILLLVSASFLESEFCHTVELQRAIERHKGGDALVIPVMLRPCDVGGTVVEGLQQLPEDGKPITKWGNRDEACEDVAKRLRVAVEEWNSRSRKSVARVPAPSDAVEAKDDVHQASLLNRIFGFGRSVNLAWLRTVLARGAAVARIRSGSDGRPFGTGFLVDPSAFGLGPASTPLLLTASFVIEPETGSNTGHGGLRPEAAVAEFQVADVTRGVRSVLWSSPVGELFSVLVSLDGPVDAQPLVPTPKPWHPDELAPRVVVIGHPGGRDLEFSLQDTILMDADDTRLHYRAATEGGSSGSPVLSANDLQVLAIHTARSAQMRRLRERPGTYEACEGISLHAIQRAVREREALE